MQRRTTASGWRATRRGSRRARLVRCPGQVGTRPMVETCQSSTCTRGVLAGAEATPDGAQVRAETGRRVDPASLGGKASRGEAVAAEGMTRAARQCERCSATAADPHAVPRWCAPARRDREGRDPAPAWWSTPMACRASAQSRAMAPPAAAPAAAVPASEGWYQKLAARGTHKYSELLVSARPRARRPRGAGVAGKSAALVPVRLRRVHGDLCEQRRALRPNQCSGRRLRRVWRPLPCHAGYRRGLLDDDGGRRRPRARVLAAAPGTCRRGVRTLTCTTCRSTRAHPSTARSTCARTASSGNQTKSCGAPPIDWLTGWLVG